MNIGDLKHRVFFEQLTSTINENGFEIESWEVFRQVWASISNLNGREYFAAAAVQSEKTVKFTVRYIEGIDESMRIFFDEKQYNITSIDNIKYEKKFLEIKAMEVVDDG